MTTLTPTPKQQFLDANGNPLSGGKVYTYAAGTTTPLATYTDQGGSTPNTNPVILDSRGEAAIWLGVASYKLKLTTATDVEIWTVDNIVSANTQTLANLSEAGGSALVGYLPAGTGAVATTVQTKLRETVSVKDFGAVGDGVVDDTVAIQAAIDAVVANGRVIGDAQGVYKVTGRIDISDKELRDIRLTYTTNSALIVAKGKARLTNITISVGSTIRTFLNPLPGVINLHLATGVVLDNIEITDGITDRIGVFCSTLASNTTIRNCRMNYIGWPILFNDNIPAQRIVDGIDYAGQSIGSGLYISGCALGAADKTAVGDAIEINCPSQRFSNIKVSGCVVLKTNTSGANGLGIAAANCDGFQVSDCLVRNVASAAGALHAEAFTAVSFTNNLVELSVVGIGLGIDGNDVLIDGNTINTCTASIQCTGSAASMTGVTISGNQIIDSSNNAIVFTNVSAGIISNNYIKNVATTGAGKSYVSLLQTGALTTNNHNIIGNTFSRVGGADVALLGSSGVVSEVYSRTNIFYGISGSTIAGYLIAVRAVGLSEDYYRAAGTTSAINGKISINPTGYVTGSSGDFMTDVNAGVLYRHDGTNWVSKVS
jgi:hypothetical protein